MSAAQAAQPNWPALALEAWADVKANKPLPAAAPMTEAELNALLVAMRADLPVFAAYVQAHPGWITAAGRFLTALADVRLPSGGMAHPWAGTLKAALDGLPGGLAAVAEFMPIISGMIEEFRPAPQNPDLTTNSRGR